MHKFIRTIVIAIIITLVSAMTVVANAAKADERILQRFDKGSKVLVMQKQLVAKGYLENNDCSGAFDVRTKRAVKDFQKYNGLKVNGILDTQTRDVLFGDAKAPNAAETETKKIAKKVQSAEASFVTLKARSEGTAVTKLQQKLIALGYMGEKDATGFYGTGTVSAVKAFQQNNGITPDGICGQVTYEAIFSANAKKKPAESKPAVSTVKLGSRSIRPGDSGSDVVAIQKKLIARGYLQGDATGYYGSSTTAAVERFQRAHNIVADGICGSKTISLLMSSSSSSSSSNKTVDLSKSGTLRQGAKGAYVKALQNKLKSKGYFGGDVNGVFNEATVTAVKKFQRAQGITADGVAGPATIRLLCGISSKNTASSSSYKKVNASSKNLTEKQKTDIYWIARLIYAESGNQPYEGKVAVGSVVMNRLEKFGGTVYSIIFAHQGNSYQFTPAKTGKVYNTPTKECIKAAVEAYFGAKPVGSARYFVNTKRGQNSWAARNCTFVRAIGAHSFYK